MTDPRRTHALTPLIQAVPAFPVAFVFLLGPVRELIASRGLGVIALTHGGAMLCYLGRAAVSLLRWARTITAARPLGQTPRGALG